MKKKLTINGMSCNHCVMHVKQALEGLEGADKVKVKIGKASVVVPDDFDTALIGNAVKEAGYEVESIS